MIKILVVDDDRNIRRLMKAVLEQEGYGVITANDGKEALAMLDVESVALVIVDVMMPNLNGYEFTETVRLMNQDMPILMLSAKQLPVDVKQGFKSGVDDYVMKPVDTEELLLRIKALLRRAKINSDRKITLGDIELDSDSFTVKGHGKVFELPQKEFQLLYKLLSYPEKIFTRIQLMDEIWGMNSETGWETVTVHINRLRKRFEEWSEFEIQSVRGLGYKAVRRV